jgi:hypothetical protein
MAETAQHSATAFENKKPAKAYNGFIIFVKEE